MPEKYTIKTDLDKKKLLKKLRGSMVEYRPSMNILSTGRFMRAHRTESVYYGRIEGDKVMMFYHKAGKRDGGSTGFFGKITENGDGCTLSGSFRKPTYAYVTVGVYILLTLLCALGAYAGGSNTGALVFLGLGVLGAAVMLWDNSKKMLRSYLESLINS